MRIAFGRMPGPFPGCAFNLGMLRQHWRSLASKHGCAIIPHLPEPPCCKRELSSSLGAPWKVPGNIPTGILGKASSGISASAPAFPSERQEREATGEHTGLQFFLPKAPLQSLTNHICQFPAVVFQQHFLNHNFHALLNSSTL